MWKEGLVLALAVKSGYMQLFFSVYRCSKSPETPEPFFNTRNLLAADTPWPFSLSHLPSQPLLEAGIFS